jgi:hypothetical protein
VEGPEDARTALLGGLIDHAPLFPPASLDLPAALEEDRRARESSAAFALGRFVCPASRLDGLPETPRALSVVLDGVLLPRAGVEAVESPFRDSVGDLAGLAGEVYVEVPVDDRLERRLDELAAHGLRAKIRCGGASVPTVHELARFLRGCRERRLPFKATAGLHHTVRAGGEHGLLNLLAAVVFETEADALSEEEPEAFALTAEGFRWRERVASAADVSRARAERLRSVGSCSFFEPIGELEAMGALGR